jgi:hypothetical protein
VYLCTPVILALRRLNEEDRKFKANLSYILSPCLKKQKSLWISYYSFLKSYCLWFFSEISQLEKVNGKGYWDIIKIRKMLVTVEIGWWVHGNSMLTFYTTFVSIFFLYQKNFFFWYLKYRLLLKIIPKKKAYKFFRWHEW